MTATCPDHGALRIEVSRAADCDVDIIAVDGAVDMASVDRFRQALKHYAGTSTPRVLLDCRRIRFINSGGMGALYACHCACRDAGGGLVLSGAEGKFLDLISTIGLDRVLSRAESKDEAVALLSHGARQEPAN